MRRRSAEPVRSRDRALIVNRECAVPSDVFAHPVGGLGMNATMVGNHSVANTPPANKAQPSTHDFSASRGAGHE
jgi:hypothetical protein